MAQSAGILREVLIFWALSFLPTFVVNGVTICHTERSGAFCEAKVNCKGLREFFCS